MKIPVGLIDKTFRQVKPTLEALGFKVGRITYVDNIGKDMVLKLTHKGKTIKAGDKFLSMQRAKHSKSLFFFW